jgi:serine/threonine-protein kinase
VLLYLLLSGVPPFDGRGAAGFEPLPPSRAVVRGATEAPAFERAHRRATTPRRLAQALRGDLDTMVLKAMKAAPQERYASVLALADDLTRWLEGRAVLARPDSLAYRCGKFVRRHRLGVSMTVALAGVAIAGVIGVAREARLADEQRARAERVKDFVVSVFTEQDPLSRRGGGPPSPQALVSAAAQRLDHDLKDQPEIHAELLDDLGEIAADLGDYQKGASLLRRAVEERSSRHGADSLPVAQSLRKLARAIDLLGQSDEAERLSRQALSILLRHGAGDSLEAARTKVRLSQYLANGKGAPAEAMRLNEEAARDFERLEGPDHPDTVLALVLRAQAFEQDRRDAEAERLLRDALARARRSQAVPGPVQGDALLLLARVLRRGGQQAESLACHEQAIQIFSAQFGSRSHNLAAAQTSLGALDTEMGRFEAALKAYDAAAAALPEGAVSRRGDLLRERARLQMSMKHFAEAERDFHEAYDLRLQQLGPKNAFTWYFSGQWGTALAALGRVDEAETRQREAVRQVAALLGPDAYQNTFVADDLADTLQRRPGGHAEVIELRRRSLALTAPRFDRRHPIWVSRALALAESLSRKGDPATSSEALALLDEVVAADRAGVVKAEEQGRALLARGRLRLRSGDRGGAEADLAEALRRLKGSALPQAEAVTEASALLNRP